MSTFVIPYKTQPIQTPKLNLNNECDAKLLLEAPPCLHDTIVCGINEQNIKFDDKLTELHDRHFKDKIRYISTMVETYNKLMSEIKLSVEIGGYYTSHRMYASYDRPESGIEAWAKYNLGRMDAINVIVKDLESKGWSPKVTEKNKYDPDYGGCYSGYVTITCDFRQ